MNRRNFIKYSLAGIASAIVLSPLEALADTVYYGKIEGAKTPAWVIFDSLKTESKYHAQLPDKNSPNYDKILAQRNNSVYTAIRDVATNNKYDVVVEKDDPAINGYVDITEEVKKKIKENESNL